MMTREEKVAQLGSAWVFQIAEGTQLAPGPAAGAPAQRDRSHHADLRGELTSPPEGAAELANAIQRYLVEETRLGIPAIVHEEICSGLMARDATVFPQAIGLASTWDPALARSLAEVDRRPDARRRRAPRPRSRPGRVPRSALGPHRGDVRRGSVSRRPDGRRVRARAAGRVAARRRDRDGEALRRVRRLGRRDELGACRHSAAGAAGGVPPSVRGSRSGRPRRLRDERVQRGRRRRLHGRSRAPHRDPARGVGVRRLRRLGLLLDPAAGVVPSARGGRPGGGGDGDRRRARPRASLPPIATASRSSTLSKSAL